MMVAMGCWLWNGISLMTPALEVGWRAGTYYQYRYLGINWLPPASPCQPCHPCQLRSSLTTLVNTSIHRLVCFTLT